jgi:1-acylglycerone phosphate reductase
LAGLHVIATARNKDVLKDLEAVGMSTLSLDVTNGEDVEKARKAVEVLTGGKLDILVNNACAPLSISSPKETLN